jgi:hypothetical protein
MESRPGVPPADEELEVPAKDWKMVFEGPKKMTRGGVNESQSKLFDRT